MNLISRLSVLKDWKLCRGWKRVGDGGRIELAVLIERRAL